LQCLGDKNPLFPRRSIEAINLVGQGKKSHNTCGIRSDCGGETLVFWPLTQCYNIYIKCALDFPGKKANLHLPLLNILGGCAMLGTYCCPTIGEIEKSVVPYIVVGRKSGVIPRIRAYLSFLIPVGMSLRRAIF
jgi:hypothetical protein